MLAATVEASRSTPGLGEPGSASKRRSSYAAPVRITSTPGGSATRSSSSACSSLTTTAMTSASVSWYSTSGAERRRSEEHTSELQSLMRHSYAVFCLQKKKKE